MPALNLEAFNKSLETWSKKQVPETVQKVHRVVALEGLRRIVLKTPVDTGRARSNWQVSIGALPTEGPQPEIKVVPGQGAVQVFSKGAGDTLAKGDAVLKTMPPFSVSYIANSLPYIEVLEYGQFNPPNPGPSKDSRRGRKDRVLVQRGYSVQAPRGMVGVTYQELQVAFQGIVHRVAGGGGAALTGPAGAVTGLIDLGGPPA